MVAGCITEEIPVAVPAELMWKLALGDAKSAAALIPKAAAGYIDAVEVDGDGGPGSVTTMKFNPSLKEEIETLKSKVVAFDAGARVVKMEVLEGGAARAQLKTQVVEMKVEEAAAGGGCVFKVKVEYENLDGGAALTAEEEAKLVKGHVLLIKLMETYLVAHPGEFA